MKVEHVTLYACDVCGAETRRRDEAGWVTVSARAVRQVPCESRLRRVRYGKVEADHDDPVDLCSRECAATWLFGAP